MRLDDMYDALYDLGQGRWVAVTAGVEYSSAPQARTPHELPLAAREPRWVWPHDLAVSIEVEWLAPVEAGWLEPVGARLVQPVNLIGRYAGTAVTAIAGLIVWPGWQDPDVDVHRLGAPWVLGMPDDRGRVLRGETASLGAALDLLHEIDSLDSAELADLVGLRLVDARVDPPSRSQPLNEEPF